MSGLPVLPPTLRELIATQFAFLAFRPVRINVREHFWRWFLFVLAVTWIAGVGRYWDHPAAHAWQYAGLGSVAYLFCLSTLLFLVVWPLKPRNWSWRGVLVFVGLTSLPALLYAIPIERFTDLEAAQAVNAWFLGIVAVWRVALLARYLATAADLQWPCVLIVMLLLLSGIVFSLAMLNLEHVVFDLMAGIRESDASPNDTAYAIVFMLGALSTLVFPVALLSYLGAIVWRFRAAKLR